MATNTSGVSTDTLLTHAIETLTQQLQQLNSNLATLVHIKMSNYMGDSNIATPKPDTTNNKAFRWVKNHLQPISHLSAITLDDLIAIDQQKAQVVRNTQQFVQGLPANHVLLTGSRGVGKSSLIRALLNQFMADGLRVIEVEKQDLQHLHQIMDVLHHCPEKFIIYCDDLTFGEQDVSFHTLKTLLDGSLYADMDNVLIYASSNRRHLIPEYQVDNTQIGFAENGEVRLSDAIDDKISLSDRFGLCLYFYPNSQDDYLAMVQHWLKQYGISLNETLRKEAIQWATQKGNRSGRTAIQFTKHVAGKLELREITSAQIL